MAYHQFDEGTPEEKARMLGSVAAILVPGFQVTKAGKVGKVLGEVEDVVSQAAKDALQGITEAPESGPGGTDAGRVCVQDRRDPRYSSLAEDAGAAAVYGWVGGWNWEG